MTYAVYGLGNALVDIEVEVDDTFLSREQITKGHMTLIDSARMQQLLDALGELPQRRASGGSAANTVYAVQSFGHETCYVCKVADDETGRFFIDDLAASGVQINRSAKSDEGTSGRCLVMVSPDAQRSMTTDLGISSELSTSDIQQDALRQSRYFYVEGYLSSSPASTEAAIACREIAQDANVAVSVSLSDPSMVEFCRDSLKTILGNGVDQVFCNAEEAMAWARTDRLDVAISELKDIAPELYVTLGAQGSVAVSKHGHQTAQGEPAHAIDTTGAGDIFAGACLAARCHSASPLDAARFANRCAAVLVGQYGARLPSPAAYAALGKQFT
jgi:sugar/nucleoside kinase (ribokinase family)